jgi:ABC-type multidrug transport system ATPase subunit
VTAPALELRDLEVLAGMRRVAGPISLVHHTGAVLWLTGENGAGKSTLLRALAQRARYRGTLIGTPRLRRDALCYYAPTMHFSPCIHVADWLALHRRLQPERHTQTDALLPTRAHGPIDRLSTGEAKRLALWSVLRPARAYYVLDEPFEHLSPTAKTSLRNIIARLAVHSVVVVATNQEIPSGIPARVLELD